LSKTEVTHACTPWLPDMNHKKLAPSLWQQKGKCGLHFK